MKATLGERGQVTIPKSVRERLGLRPGQRLEVVEEEGRVVMTKDLDDDPIARVYGSLRVQGAMSTDAMIEALRGPAEIPPRRVITAVDSSVLIDILIGDPTHGEASATALRQAGGRGAVLACDVVWAEVAAWYRSASQMRADMEDLGISFSPMDAAAAERAGAAWATYRRGSGKRTRVIADFLIGAHASLMAEALLTRDRGFQRRYFRSLTIIEPDIQAIP